MTIIQAQPLEKYGISGPTSTVNNEVPVFDGTSGKVLKTIPGLTIEIIGDICTFKVDKNVLFDVLGNVDIKSGLIYVNADHNYVGFGGGIVQIPTSKTGSYTTNTSDNLIICDGTFTIELNAIITSGQILTIKNKGTGTITIDGSGSQTIDGDLTQTLSQWEYITIASEKETLNWLIIAGGIPSGSGDMLKSIYDTNEDGLVDEVEALDGGTW